ncbi:hypothetical protein SASPL_144712 [Salvia splendens]|uniref:HECT-type E3 ubiquitin transferase n=1 Tax=Salvia splendens TaxID=180675 RepID=A0A8X8WFS8_SALSN|nr:hypothetical protein SASPL_144712 [Salvia splendens]
MSSSLSKRKLDDYAAADSLLPPINPIRNRKDKISLRSPSRLEFSVTITNQTLAECKVENFAELSLVGRMRSTKHWKACQLINECVPFIFIMCNEIPPLTIPVSVKLMLAEFLSMIPRMDLEQASEHLKMFSASSAPAALVMLYMSPFRSNRSAADRAIKYFVNSIKSIMLPIHKLHECLPIILEFCKLLKKEAGIDDPLYCLCRSSLGAMIECIIVGNKAEVEIPDVFSFVEELAAKLSHDLVLGEESRCFLGPSLVDINDFSAFALPLRKAIKGVILLTFHRLRTFVWNLILSQRFTMVVKVYFGKPWRKERELFVNLLSNVQRGFLAFKNEEATGPSVLLEWVFLVCQAIFNPQNALFVAWSNDCRRFYPSPGKEKHLILCKVDPLHLEYFRFSGEMIALALMHKIQVGIVFDRLFFLQLAGRIITLEDIKDADPLLYNSCKQILEMDPELVDQDALGLTFVHEVEELGTRKTVDLCTNGKSIVVNSKNRRQYVDSLIQRRFVISVADQVEYFAKGFADILICRHFKQSFFNCLEPEDLDFMLHGSESAISVDDWKAHTKYHGFKETDDQISWFWKIVGEMTAEQKKILLFFWTLIKYLPVKGFSGLASQLHIYKTYESCGRLHLIHAFTSCVSLRTLPVMRCTIVLALLLRSL